jgi:hypothetical protein
MNRPCPETAKPVGDLLPGYTVRQRQEFDAQPALAADDGTMNGRLTVPPRPRLRATPHLPEHAFDALRRLDHTEKRLAGTRSHRV